MAKPLPKRFDPDQMARDGARHETSMSLSAFERLATLLHGTDGEVRITSGFTRRKDHIVVGGRIHVAWPLECQRCLEPMTVAIDEPYEFVFVESERAARVLPEALDPVVLDENGQIRVVDLLEDELILHVPAIPKHDDLAECTDAERSFGEVEAESTGDGEGRRNPFDVLKNLNLH